VGDELASLFVTGEVCSVPAAKGCEGSAASAAGLLASAASSGRDAAGDSPANSGPAVWVRVAHEYPKKLIKLIVNSATSANEARDMQCTPRIVKQRELPLAGSSGKTIASTIYGHEVKV
jgi:hypothetical protein